MVEYAERFGIDPADADPRLMRPRRAVWFWRYWAIRDMQSRKWG